ncbi:MAG: hypothetical protein J07HQX50_00196, partial [Haloquadratum sp. J07HQX50]
IHHIMTDFSVGKLVCRVNCPTVVESGTTLLILTDRVLTETVALQSSYRRCGQ